MEREPAAFLPLDARNPQLVWRSEVTPIGVKHLADSQEGVQAKGERSIQVTVYVISGIDRKESGPFTVGEP